MSQLTPSRIAHALATEWLGRQVVHFSSVASTNEVARELAREGASEGTLVLAEEQTAGRGRLGRQWWAPWGSCLLFSLLFRPDQAAWQAQRLTMVAGLACAEAVEGQTGLRPMIKWPNDLLLDGRKLGGILTELETTGTRLAFAVVGVGLNVNVDFRRQGDAELQDTAIGLSQALGQPVDRLTLLAAVLQCMERRYDALQHGESPHREWSERMAYLGRPLLINPIPSSATSPGDSSPMRGEALAVDADGALIVRFLNGETKRIWAGDVTWCDRAP